MEILQEFDSGSIEVIDSSNIDNIVLKLEKDSNANTTQWFHFHCITQAGLAHRFRIVNAGESSFSSAWNDYQVMASYDRENWFRVVTEFKDGELQFKLSPEQGEVTFAYFTPYGLDRQSKFIESASKHPVCKHSVLTKTPNNNSIDLLTIGEPAKGKKSIWLIARQHPGETMAQWFAEGFVDGLLSENSSAHELLQQAVFYVVPNMNPDGSELGNHRTNFHGLNLNREWNSPSKELSPEVFYVQQAMQQTGVDLLLDIHGDEEIPYSFMMAAKGRCGLAALATQFKQNFAAGTKDFQTEIDYNTYQAPQRCCGSEETKRPSSGCGTVSSGCGSSCGGKGSRSMATEYVADEFGSLALVLEMPFIDHNNQPNAKTGWSVERSRKLAKDIQQPILSFLAGS